jgi:branched-chain amino acid transport system substrate-binding protein
VLSAREAELRAKRILAYTPILSLLLAAACTSSKDASADKSDIVIGASLELSGNGSEVGNAYKQALNLKVNQLSRSGTLNGRKVRLDIRDNRGDPGTAKLQMDNFAGNPDVTAAVMGSSSENAIAAVDTVNSKSLPTVALAPASDVSEPVDRRKFMFKLAPNIEQDAATVFTELNAATPKVKNVAVLYVEDTYGTSAYKALQHQLTTGTEIKVNVDGEFKPTDTDLTSAATAVTTAGKHPEAVVVLAYPTQANLAIVALRTAGYQGSIVLDASAAGDVFLSQQASQLAGDSTTLVFTPTLAIDDVIATTPANAARKQWFSDYTAQYGSYYAQSSFAADAVQLIVNAVDRAGSATDREAVRSAMEVVQFDGLSGPIRMAPNSHTGLMPQALTLLAARNGRWRLAS